MDFELVNEDFIEVDSEYVTVTSMLLGRGDQSWYYKNRVTYILATLTLIYTLVKMH